MLKRMSRVCLVLLVCCLWVKQASAADPKGQAPAPSAQPAAPQDAPVLQVVEATHDFGEVMEGVEVTHDFVIKNAGKSVLQIEQVRPG